MERQSKNQALNYRNCDLIKESILTYYPNTKQLGLKGGTKAFCTVRYIYKKGETKSFEISKKTYDELSINENFKVSTNSK
jgi:hypothetical protein